MSYDAYATTFSNSRKNLQWPELDAIIEDMCESGYTSVLDIGCGNGRFLEQIMNCVPKGIPFDKLGIVNYLGLDSSAGMIAEAKKLHPDYEFAVCLMESLGNCATVKLGNFDCILFLASFHHLESRAERIKVLEDIKSLIAPGGAVYMTNWNLRDQPKYESSRRYIQRISQKQEVQGREIFSKGVYGAVNEGEQNFSDKEIRSFPEISYDYDIKIGEYSRYYHGFTTDELAGLFDMTGWQIVENRVFEGGRNIYSKIILPTT